MSKTIKNSFDDKITFEKLLAAHKRASKGKRSKNEVIRFEIDLETNLINIMQDLKNNNYHFGKYREFIIYEPKERLIKSLPYRDRIVHQWFIEEFIKPFFYPRFIKDTYACIDGRGTHAAVLSLQNKMRKMQKEKNNYYVLKCDVKKYFYSIDKQVLMNILRKNISDKKMLIFIENILDDGNNVGIPIGNYTSQFFANIYLNELDHYIKETLRVKYYVRYMDDFILLVKDKEEAKKLKVLIAEFLTINLKLELNQKSKYFPSSRGINFCGYVIFPTHILLRKRFKDNFKKKIALWAYLKENNKLDKKKMELSRNSLLGHASHCNSYNFLNKMNNLYNLKVICSKEQLSNFLENYKSSNC